MTVSIGAFSTNNLTAQPFGYEGESRDGLTARRWRISGLLDKDEWDDLKQVYNGWRDTRITDEDTWFSNSVGTTVAFTGIGFAPGDTWSNIACWFTTAPTADQAGAYVSATVELIDATQALEVLLRGKEKQRQNAETVPDFGTITLGGVALEPIAPPDGRTDVPRPELTASGGHYIVGSLGATQTRRIVAYATGAEYGTLRSWFDSTVAAIPSKGTWFPTSFPEPKGEFIVEDGVKKTRYTVEITQTLIR